jgi:hypothetical protein
LVPDAERTSVANLTPVAPPKTSHYSLVGTAFDYLFRFEVVRRNKSATARSWVAERGVELAKADIGESSAPVLRWPPGVNPQDLVGKMERAYSSALQAYDRYRGMQRTTPRDLADAAGHALRLAKLDPVYRAGYVDSAPESVDPHDVEDLVALLGAIPFEGRMAPCLGPRVWLNPTFGGFSVGIQGADADVVAGGLLIDLKTTKNPEVSKNLPQIVGYAMLAEAYRTEEAPEFPAIESLGLYFSRHATLVTIPLETVRANADYPGAFSELMAHCEERPMSLSDVLARHGGTKSAGLHTPAKGKVRRAPR